MNPLCFGGDRVPQSLLTPDCQVCGGGGEKQEEIIQGTSQVASRELVCEGTMVRRGKGREKGLETGNHSLDKSHRHAKNLAACSKAWY